MRIPFVVDLLTRLLRSGELRLDQSILAVCAGNSEREVFQRLGFTNVVLSNLDERMTADAFAPFRWEFQDVQALTYPDASFDVVFVADGLHHCDSPHRALLEMYRVSRETVIVVESRDNLLMRMANRFGLSPEYELEAVFGNDFTYGGVNNTAVPNYIFRWTEREFEKTIASYAPHVRHSFRYFYGFNLPFSQAEMKKSSIKYLVLLIARPFLYLFTRLARRQGNTFGMVVRRPALPEGLWPWLKLDAGQVVPERSYYTDRFVPPAASPEPPSP